MVTPLCMWDSSSLRRNQTPASFIRRAVLTTGPPGMSLFYIPFISKYIHLLWVITFIHFWFFFHMVPFVCVKISRYTYFFPLLSYQNTAYYIWYMIFCIFAFFKFSVKNMCLNQLLSISQESSGCVSFPETKTEQDKSAEYFWCSKHQVGNKMNQSPLPL